MTLFAQKSVSLRPFTTLRAGGCAELFAVARSADELADWAIDAQSEGRKATYLGWGSNVLPSDDGVPGLVIVNAGRNIEIDRSGEIVADAGCGFQELFLKSAQAGLQGLEYAVGIPGTLGGALVSNAGAYRSCISDSVTAIEIVSQATRRWVEPDTMRFAYRDSILRAENPPPICLLRVKLTLEPGVAKEIYDEAREFQRQRIGKQPAPASAGSFFKNVEDRKLAERLDGLRPDLKQAGVVPSGFLIEACNLKGMRHRGAMVGAKHANFLLNVGGAAASDIRALAHHVKRVVFDRFGAELEEEVLYLGNWDAFVPEPID